LRSPGARYKYGEGKKNEMTEYKNPGEFIVYMVPIPEDVDPKTIGVDFKKQNGFLFTSRNKKSLYGVARYGGVRYKMMVVRNKYKAMAEGTDPEADVEIPG